MKEAIAATLDAFRKKLYILGYRLAYIERNSECWTDASKDRHWLNYTKQVMFSRTAPLVAEYWLRHGPEKYTVISTTLWT